MKTKNMSATIIAVALIVLVCTVACVALFFYSEDKKNYEVIKLIHDRQKRPGEFIDMDGQVQVNSVYDLGFVVKDTKLELHYGVQTIDIPFDSFGDQEWMDALDSIGIHVYRRMNDETKKYEYRITYWGEPIQEWSKVT